MSSENGWLSLREAAAILDVHWNTLRRWTDQGVITYYRFGPRGDRKFKREDLDRYLERIVVREAGAGGGGS